jgi:N-acetylglucosaminyl-diphospho-decaprenol L-rhamnosyltransferase
MPVMGVDVAVVIVTYNSAAVICSLLDSITRTLDGMIADITVVDNGSTDETVMTVSNSFADVRVVRSSNLGYSAGINRGVAEMRDFDSILVLNPDVVLMPGAISAMKLALKQERVGVVAPRLLDAHGELTLSLRREPSIARSLGFGFTGLPSLSERVTDPRAYTRTMVADWATGAVLMIDPDCFYSLGGWDESFFLYSEETDFCLRARDYGWTTTYVPNAVAVHAAGGSGRSARTEAMQALNQVRLFRRRNKLITSWIYYLLAIIAELSRLMRRRPNSLSTLGALVSPRRRPPELGLANNLLPT